MSAHRIALLAALLAAPMVSADVAPPTYLGRPACLACHAAGKAAQACTLEPVPEHDRSWRALGSERAPHVAALTGTAEPPATSQLCLGCHSTAADVGARWRAAAFALEDGVQCEACHGAGSLHARMRGEDPAAHEPAPPLGIRRGDRADCRGCHRDRPSHDEVLERGYRVPEADRLYKSPVNLAVSPDGRRVYVACERSDSLIVVDAQEGTIVGETRVGMRPQDVALSPDGSRAFVTNRFSRSVSVVDAASMQVAGEIAVGDDPHGVLATASRVYVLETGADTISVIDATRLQVVRRLAAGDGPWSLALRGDGMLVASSVRSRPAAFREPHRSEATIVGTRDDVVAQRPLVADADIMQGVAIVPGRDVALMTLMRTKNLVPVTRLSQGWVVTNGLGVLWRDGRVDQVLLDEPDRHFPEANDVAVSPDGHLAVVTSGGANEVAFIDVDALLALVTSSDDAARAVLPDRLGTCAGFIRAHVAVESNPRGVAFSPDGRLAYVAETLNDSVAVLDARTFRVVRRIALGGPAQVTATRRGERLFHDASTTQGRQFSCKSCHPDGHHDGLAFDIEADGLGLRPVENRTLRGIFDTAPFKWEGTNPSLQRQCGARFAVFFTRLDPFTPAELDALVAYVRTIEAPTNPNRAPGGLTLSQRRGKLVFERTVTNEGTPIAREDRCTTCHDGGYRSAGITANTGTSTWFDAPMDLRGTDLSDENAFGALGASRFEDEADAARLWDVPSLRNVRASRPFLHDGTASSLEEIWTRHDLYQRHGISHDLTRRQLIDLVAYLLTL